MVYKLQKYMWAQMLSSISILFNLKLNTYNCLHDIMKHFKILIYIWFAWKASVFGVILVRIFRHLDWIRRDTPYLSVFSSNAGKCGKNADQNNS